MVASLGEGKLWRPPPLCDQKQLHPREKKKGGCARAWPIGRKDIRGNPRPGGMNIPQSVICCAEHAHPLSTIFSGVDGL